MPDYEDMHNQFEAEQIKKAFSEGDFSSLRRNQEKIDYLIQKYKEMPEANKERIQEMETIDKIINGKFLMGM